MFMKYRLTNDIFQKKIYFRNKKIFKSGIGNLIHSNIMLFNFEHSIGSLNTLKKYTINEESSHKYQDTFLT